MAKTLSALVVDQDIQARFDLKQVVKASGLMVAGESSFGMEAVSSAQETRPDLVLVGVNEPMERALQTVSSLAAVMPDTPIIAYSDSRDIEGIRKAMLAGARDFLPKPVRPEVLRDSVMKAMEAEENRRLRRTGQLEPAPTRGTVVTVFGAKGGVGKSTIATNLAVALARGTQASVAIVDLDNAFGDVAGMLDLKPERTLTDLVRDLDKVQRDDLHRYVSRHQASGLDVIPAPAILEWREIPADGVERALDLLAKAYDTVILDTSGTINDISELAVESATMILWVTTTEFASVRDTIEAMKALQVLAYSDERVRVVLNAISPDDVVRPSVVQEALKREVFWSIPYDKKVRQGAHLGQPIVVSAPQTVAARSLANLAVLISGGRVESSRKWVGGFKWRGGAQPAAAEGR